MGIENRKNIPGRPQGKISFRMCEMNGFCTLDKKKRNGKQIRVLAGQHHSSEAVRLIREVIEPEIKDKNDWVFLIEGGEIVDLIEDKERLGESYVAVKLAKEKEIPVRDPIVPPSDLEVIKLYTKTNNDPDITYERVIGSLAFQAMKDMESSRAEDVFEPIGAIYDMSADRLMYCLQETISEMIRKLPDQSRDWEEKLRERLLGVSNAISIQVFDYYLRMFNVNDVLLYCGAAHKPMLDIEQYQIPSALKLSDREIERIANERLARYQRMQERIDKWLSRER